MNKLTHIEGTLQISGGMRTLDGPKKLTSIGGNIRIPRTFNGAALDDFLNQLTEFSGTITYAN
ncbi:MAG: hypothetical protein R3E66_10980 [bacterium]